jgi:hypothetical protein
MSLQNPRKQAESALDPNDSESLIKSRKRVIDHGEVFTSNWMVNDMLDLVKDESERIDSRFLEPAYRATLLLIRQIWWETTLGMIKS